jgi:DNA-binding CsgD family transcriptional regulator
MPGANATDLRAVLRFAEHTLDVTDVPAVETVLLPGLAALVGGDAATLNETDVGAPRQVTISWPPERITVERAERLRPLLLTHPFAPVYRDHLAGTVSRQPFRISDLMSRRAWHSTAVWAEALRDTDDQLGLVLGRRSGALRNVLVSRTGRPFTDRERELVRLASRHVAAAARRVHAGRAVGLQIAPRAGWVPLGATTARDRPAIPLSAREQEVLRLVAAGLTDAQVARQLGLSPRTVSKHLERVYARLGVPNRAAAVLRWSALRKVTVDNSP